MHLHPTLTAAAESMAMAQPAASALLRSLERRLGFPLFTREYRRLEMTSQGRALLPEILQAYASMAALDRTAREIAEGGERRLTLGVVAIAAASLLPEALTSLYRRAGPATVTLRAGTALDIIEMAADQRIDLGVVIGHPDSERVASQPLAELGLYCIAPPDHPLAQPSPVPLDVVTRHPYVVLGDSLPGGRLTRQALARSAHVRPPTVEVMQSVAACALVSAGLGVGIVETLGALYAQRQGLCARPLAVPTSGLSLNVIWPRGRPLHGLAQALVDELTVHTARLLQGLPAGSSDAAAVDEG